MTTDGEMVDPARARELPPDKLLNEEQPIHPLYAYLYVVDKFEGLVVVNAATLLDGDPLNNYLKRQLDPNRYPEGAFNPEGALNGANNITIAGTHAYITTDRELVIVNIDDPLSPKIVSRSAFKHPQAIAVQFRYGFVVDDESPKSQVTFVTVAPGGSTDGVKTPSIGLEASGVVAVKSGTNCGFCGSPLTVIVAVFVYVC